MGGSSMKIYQLAASGHWLINHARYTAYSTDCYRTEETARAQIPTFFKYMTTPKRKDDNMVMQPKGLRIFIHILDLKNNEKKEKGG